MVTSTSPNNLPSPWHAGEVELQRSVGSYEKMAVVGPKVIRPYMPDQHRRFFEELPFIVLGSLDHSDRPWATLRAGEPGFVHSPDDTHLRIAAGGDEHDPAAFEVGASVGMLGIQPHTRRRNRANGVVQPSDTGGLHVHVTQSFGNCPRFITRREAVFKPLVDRAPAAEHLEQLDTDARTMIERADTFFVASYVRHEDDSTDVDVSHRGGPAGFVRIDERGALVVPDYAGNNFFNTLGNFVRHPVAGLLFVDFENGDMLQMTGRVTLRLAETSDDAQRHWSVTPDALVRRRGAVPLRWRT
ncbi:MAG: pyridoxamine 5'-phosphate oxidase family protein [Nannocystales bacterium]